MDADYGAVRWLVNALILAVPLVVTCGGEMLSENELRGHSGAPSVTGAGAPGGARETGGKEPAKGGAKGRMGKPPELEPGGAPNVVVSIGGDSDAGSGGAPDRDTSAGGTGAATSQPTSGKVFLGKYSEPVEATDYRVPAPPATAWVTRPCDERSEACSGKTRAEWAKDVVERCMAETKSSGCIDFIFEEGRSCSEYVVVWHGATLEMARCVSTVTYYESCDAPSEAERELFDVQTFGADCSPL